MRSVLRMRFNLLKETVVSVTYPNHDTLTCCRQFHTKIGRSLSSKWSSYRHRFLPWMLLNLKQKSPRTVSSENDKIVPDQHILDQLVGFFTLLGIESSMKISAVDRLRQPLEVMENYFGFAIERKTSTIRDGGVGVYVTKGKVKQGSLVALYPGTIYRLMEPLLLPSIGNCYIFQCIDGIRIDGKNRGISGSIFKSCARRDVCWPHLPADLSWLSHDLQNPLNVGQFVNNQTSDYPCNVSYQECNLPLDSIPIELQRYLPNVYYSGLNFNNSDQSRVLRIVALIAIKDVEVDSELFSTYYTVVHK